MILNFSVYIGTIYIRDWMDVDHLRKVVIDMMEGDLNESNAHEFECAMARYLKAGGTEEDLVYALLDEAIADAAMNHPAI